MEAEEYRDDRSFARRHPRLLLSTVSTTITLGLGWWFQIRLALLCAIFLIVFDVFWWAVVIYRDFIAGDHEFTIFERAGERTDAIFEQIGVAEVWSEIERLVREHPLLASWTAPLPFLVYEVRDSDWDLMYKFAMIWIMGVFGSWLFVVLRDDGESIEEGGARQDESQQGDSQRREDRRGQAASSLETPGRDSGVGPPRDER